MCVKNVVLGGLEVVWEGLGCFHGPHLNKCPKLLCGLSCDHSRKQTIRRFSAIVFYLPLHKF